MTESLAALCAAHAAGRSVVAAIEAVYARIAAHDDPALFITLRPRADALAIAHALDAEGPRGRALLGAPFVVKDNIDVAGLPTTGACTAFTRRPAHSAFVVARLEQAGAIVIGKTNLDQFATGLVGVRSPYGAPRNALRADLIPGGSSSGSASAVGAGLVPFSLGTDTAGSGRVPAACNGIVGLKPTLGVLSMSGVAPACRTLDTVSIFARDVADATAVFEAAAGYDPADPWSRAAPAAAAMGPHPRIGVPLPAQRLFFGDTIAAAAYEADLARLAGLGATLAPVDMTAFFAVAALLYEGPFVAERYAATKPLIDAQPEALLPITRGIIEGARRYDATAAFEAIYRLAALRRETEAAWRAIDMLCVPTMPRFYTLADVAADPLGANARLGTYTNFVNLLDLAAVAAPSGLRADGLPSSLTLIGPAGSDAALAHWAARIHGVGAPPPACAPTGWREIAVVGAHLSGFPLNHELTSRGAVYVRTAHTAPDYKFFLLPGGAPPKPGLLRVAAGAGHSIEVEVWALPPAGFGDFVAGIPAPLGIGVLRLADAKSVQGFLVEAQAVREAPDIGAHGGWRAYMAALAQK